MELEASMKQSELATGIDLLCDLWYRGQQDGRETRSRHGLILADDTTQSLIHAINASKERFRQHVNAEKADRKHWKERLQTLQEQPTSLREKLIVAGLNRIHLKQCFRHIPLLEEAPSKVGFSWYAHGRSIKILSTEEAESRLLAIGDDKPHIQIQLAKLGQLSPDTRLAQTQTLAPVVRANLVFGQGDDKRRKAMNVSLPLFVPDTTGVLPHHNRITPEPPLERTRQARADQRISDEPFLPSIRVYTYR